MSSQTEVMTEPPQKLLLKLKMFKSDLKIELEENQKVFSNQLKGDVSSLESPRSI